MMSVKLARARAQKLVKFAHNANNINIFHDTIIHILNVKFAQNLQTEAE
jgi:hypothetical protein